MDKAQSSEKLAVAHEPTGERPVRAESPTRPDRPTRADRFRHALVKYLLLLPLGVVAMLAMAAGILDTAIGHRLLAIGFLQRRKIAVRHAIEDHARQATFGGTLLARAFPGCVRRPAIGAGFSHARRPWSC